MKTETEPISVLIFNRSFYPEKASTGQLLTELCEDLVKKGDMKIAVVTGHPTGEDAGQKSQSWSPMRREQYNGIEILRTGSSQFSKKSIAGRVFNYISYFVLSFFAGFRVKQKPKVVVAYTDPPIIGLVAWFFRCFYRARFVFVSQDIFPQVVSVLEGFQNVVVSAILERISRFLLRRADVVIAIGETMKERIVRVKKIDPRKIQVIHNWADSSIIHPAPKNNAFAREYALADRFVVMHSGNIGLTQSMEVIIEAAKQLAAYEDIQFVIVGEGVKKQSLVELSQKYGLKNVQFIPYQPKERLSESFSSADLFVISLKDGLAGYIVPSKLYGILAAGRPFVASIEKDSEVHSILEAHQCGLWVKPQDASELAGEILHCRNDRSLLASLSANALTASRNFDRRIQVDRYRTLFLDLALNRHPESLPSNSGEIAVVAHQK